MGAEKLRQLREPWRRALRALAIALALYIVAYIANVPYYLGLPIYGSHRPLVYGVVLFLIFLLVPGSRGAPRDRVPWYDVLAAFAALAACLYLFVRWEALVFGLTEPGRELQLFAAIAFAASLEAARRCLGWVFSLLGLFFIFYPLLGNHFPGFLFTKQYSFERLATNFYASEVGLFGLAMNLFTTVVAIFFLFGALVNASRASDLLMGLGMALTGHLRGGAAKMAVLSSGLFGMLSGVGAANVVVTGSFTIPLMKRQGFLPHVAAAVEAAASSGGTLMPPVMGAAAFIMADLLGMPYWGLVLAAFLPAILYYLALFLMVDAHAALLGVRSSELEHPSVGAVLRRHGQFAVPILVLVGLMDWGYTAQTAALWASVVLVAVSYLRRETRLGWREVAGALEAGTYGFLGLAPAAGVIGILMASVDMTGLGLTLASGLVEAAGGRLLLLLVYVALASIVIGMAASPLLVYVLLAILLVPAMTGLGVLPLAAHMFVFYFSVASLLTPPVALSSLTAAGLAQAGLWATGLEAVRLSAVAFVVPFFFVFQPALLLQGSAQEVAQAVVTALIGTLAFAGGLSGYLAVGRVGGWARLFLLVGGLGMVHPGLLSDLVGLLLLLPPAVQLWKGWRASREAVGLDVLVSRFPVDAAKPPRPDGIRERRA